MGAQQSHEANQPRLVRTWYGVTGEVVIEGELWHWVRLGRVPIPHPPLINLLIRRGLPRQAKRQLSYWHEVGHMQTLPLALAHAWLLTRGGPRRLWLRIHLALLGHEALWELAAESYVVWKAGPTYRRLYRRYRNPFMPLFWLLMAALAAVATLCSRKMRIPHLTWKLHHGNIEKVLPGALHQRGETNFKADTANDRSITRNCQGQSHSRCSAFGGHLWWKKIQMGQEKQPSFQDGQ